MTPGIILISSDCVAPRQSGGVNEFVVQGGADFRGIYRNLSICAGDDRDGRRFRADLQVNVGNRAAVTLVEHDAIHFPV